MILDGRRRPGSRLAQQALARQFGVAQSVIREALLELQARGLVEASYNRGLFVSHIDAQRLLESFEVREAHERLAVRLCCERTTRADLRQLAQTAERAYSLGKAGRLDEMGALDREFHQRLVRLSGNGMLVRLAESHWVLGKTVRIGRDPRVVRAEHLAILKAIEAGDADEAERVVRDHIRVGREVVQEQMKAGRFVPHWVP